MLRFARFKKGCPEGSRASPARRTLTAAFAACLLAAVLAACSERPAGVLCFVPVPPDQETPYAKEYSHEAALAGARMIHDEGYAAVMPGASDRPSACVLLAVNEDASKNDVLEQARLVGADLVAFLWIQRVETAAIEGSGDHAEWGGFVLFDTDGRELLGSRSSVDVSNGVTPSVAYLKILPDGDPRGLPAARMCARRLIGTPVEFGRKLDKALESL